MNQDAELLRVKLAQVADNQIRSERQSLVAGNNKHFRFSAEEGARFMRIVSETLRVNTHNEIFKLLQSPDFQALVPHVVFICAWGKLDGLPLKIDVASALPGMRTSQVTQCRLLGPLIGGTYKKWAAEGRQPLWIDSAGVLTRESGECACVLHRFMRDKRSILVHGLEDVRERNFSLYLAFSATRTSAIQLPAERHLFAAEHVIAQLDVAFRRIAPFIPPRDGNDDKQLLSTREHEVLLAAAEGKSNAEISRTLCISSFTVKNHMQRIMRKLGASNRTEAVARYRLLHASTENTDRAGESA